MKFSDLRGTLGSWFQLGLGGPALKHDAGKVRARVADDSADAPLVGSLISASGDEIELNEDAAGAGADWKYSIKRPATGMTGNVELVLPPEDGPAGYVFQTNGDGTTAWVSSATATNLEATDTTTLVFGSTATLSMFTLPANAVVKKVEVIIDTPFDGAPSASIGVAGTPSKFMPSTYVDLTAAAGTVFESSPAVPAEGSAQNLEAAYTAGGATVGSARLLVSFVIPS